MTWIQSSSADGLRKRYLVLPVTEEVFKLKLEKYATRSTFL